MDDLAKVNPELRQFAIDVLHVLSAGQNTSAVGAERDVLTCVLGQLV
jgi:hypothetical protein